jgi:hypothetical protein
MPYCPSQLQPFPIEIGKNGLDNFFFGILDVAFGIFRGPYYVGCSIFLNVLILISCYLNFIKMFSSEIIYFDGWEGCQISRQMDLSKYKLSDSFRRFCHFLLQLSQ